MVWSLARVAIPACITMVFSLLMEIVNMLFIGHFNDSAKIAGVGLGNMYVNIACQSIIIGLNGGVATLAAQAYGAKNLRKVGVILNRGRFIVLLTMVPMTFIMLNCERVLVFLKQDPTAAKYAQIYSNFLIPAMFFHS